MTIRGKRIPLSFFFLILLAAFIAMALFRSSGDSPERKDLSAVVSDVRTGQVEKLTLSGSKVEVTRTDQTAYTSRLEPSTSIYTVLTTGGATPEQLTAVAIEVKAPSTSLWRYAAFFLPIVLLVGVMLFFMR